ncbi:MAG: phenylalanine--tRNA ligase subunit beta [Alphaproteobacteria bacterium]|nr:phenylalanine--tRNA ligase subunit beta [Alphaproteobacteria bacterium]
MKWTYDWLKDYLETNASADEIADTLTRIGLEIDDVITPVVPIAAKIIECKPHENSDHLHVLMVDDGTGTPRQVVCGAPNARVGLISALAVPGCIVDGHEIQSGKLRGVLSNGMMCSEKELGLSDNHDGIIELPEETVIGMPVLSAPTVFEAGITPNRPDYLAVRGIARDLAAAGLGRYTGKGNGTVVDTNTGRNVDIKTDKCMIYRMAEIHDIKMAASDDTVTRRLRAIGINPKNACIDATNYICFDRGQPMHCFDADCVSGDITVRMAAPGETFTDLFGAEHTLHSSDIVITDDKGILALAGVIGGARGMTTDDTKNIILESAYFDPVSVRKTSKRLGISTDASYRYERGIDPTISDQALADALKMIQSTCGGQVVAIKTAGEVEAERPVVDYSPESFAKKMGIDVPADVQTQILTSLGYTIEQHKNDWRVFPPRRRVDVEIAETVIADIARIYGYDKIAAAAVHRPANPVAPHPDHALDIKRALAARGLNECRSYAFGNSKTEKLLSDHTPVMVANPIVSDLDTARGDLMGGLLQAVSNNEKRGYPDLSLFELGTVFDGDTPGAQRTALAIVRTGATGPRHWAKRNRDVDIFDVKADIVSMLAGQKYTVATDNPPRWAHPYRYGRIMQGKKVIAEFGELSPIVARELRIKTRVCIATVADIENIPQRRAAKYIPAAEFPPITRDFAFITDAATHAGGIVGTAMSADRRIVDAVVFDAFDIGNGTKSIAFTITIQPDKNMTDTDLMEIQNAVIAAVEKKCGAQIRDK